MASSSTSGVMAASSSAKAYIYDVFLSFRGEDTRHSFTDHLYKRLEREGFSTFRDDDEINRGEELKSEIERAIKVSRGSIVVLSKNYATSAWCLDELVLILEQKEECNHFVLPVFYGVEPTQVRNQTGSFSIQVEPPSSSSRWTDQNVKKWKTTLMKVANLAGHVLSGHETSFLEEIVNATYLKLDLKEVCLPRNIIGVTTRYKEIKSWFDQCNVRFLAIYGMGGSGKTTLAKYIYESHKKSFDYVSFVGDISTKGDLLEVQEQLLKDILGGKERKIPCISRGTPKIEEALQMKRVLIVLDDMVGPSQLVDLLGTKEINEENKIIITTREDPDNWLDFPYRRCQKYAMRLLDDNESSELLCHHAFKSKFPKEDFKEVVSQAVQYCDGYPLALEVLGSSMFNNDTIQFWESQLSSFERDIHSRIRNVLTRSYESLPSDIVKGLFLHIACFFNGIDKDYVVKILEHDYIALSGIQTLVNRCLLSISPNKKLKMHKLVQDMGKYIVRKESMVPANRSRVWLSTDSYKILKKGKGSDTVEGLALDMRILSEEEIVFKPSELKTDALKNMDRLKLLQLNFVGFSGSYENFSEDLRWLCWLGFHLRTIPFDLCMGNLVAIDMSYSKLEVFELPTDIRSLKILNLKDSRHLIEIRNIFMIPNIDTLVLWNCYSLINVCKTIGDLRSLTLLNMTGCENLFNREQTDLLSASTSGEVVTQQLTFSLPLSLHRLFLKDCHLERADSFPLSFSFQTDLKYLNLGNSLFESLPCYDHLENLRVLDLSFCYRLECLICLPSTLAELYIYYCESLEKITFQSHRFTLQEIGYDGCTKLYEIEGFIKLVPIAKLDETDLGHLMWLKEYQTHKVCLVGDALIVDRSSHIQMLYEFCIMSTSLPDIKNPNMTPEHISRSSSLSFDVPSCPKNKRLKGINVTFKYELSGDDWVWFCKISSANGFDLMYNPKVFGKPEFGEVCVWLSYWPIGNKLKTGDTIHVSIAEIRGLKVHECGVSLVYSDQETLEDNMEQKEILGGDMSGFQLSTGAYYLCRRDFFELTEVDKLAPSWFRILVGDTIDYTEVRGWRKTGRPGDVSPSYTELKTVRCIIHGPQLEDIYKIAEMSKSSFGYKTMAFTSSLLEGGIIDNAMKINKQEDIYKIAEMSPSSFGEATRAFPEITDYLMMEDIYMFNETSTSSSGDTTMEEDIQKMSEMSMSSYGDTTVEFTSSMLEEEILYNEMEEIYEKRYKPGYESYPYSHGSRDAFTYNLRNYERRMEVERESVKLNLSDELIKAACILSMKAHSNQYYVTHKQDGGDASSSSMEVSIIAFKGSMEVDKDDHFGETHVDCNLFPSLQRIGERQLAKVNGSVLRIFQNLLISSRFKTEVETALNEDKKILFTGHSFGGAIASLATLWMLDEYTRKRKIRLPIGCVTFGSPLIGDRNLTHAVRREKWAGHFTHFVMEHDIVPRMMLAPKASIQQHLPNILNFFHQKVKPNTIGHDQIQMVDGYQAVEFFENVLINALAVASHDVLDLLGRTDSLANMLSADVVKVSPYMPFGIYVFCTRGEDLVESTPRQQLVVENPNAVLQLLVCFLQLPNEDQDLAQFALQSLTENFGYEEELNKNGLQLENLVYLKHLNEHLWTSEGTSGDAVRTSNKALFELAASAKWCLLAAELAEKLKKINVNLIKESMRNYASSQTNNEPKIIEDLIDEILEYKTKHGDGNTDYYEAFKLLNKQHDVFAANVNRLEQGNIWDVVIQMVMHKDLPDEFENWGELVDLATRYRRLYEPLDIANFYRHSVGDNMGVSYMRVRPTRYKFTQRWYEHANAMGFESVSESNFVAEVEELMKEVGQPKKTFEEVKTGFESIKSKVKKWQSDEKIAYKDVYWGDSVLSKLQEELA